MLYGFYTGIETKQTFDPKQIKNSLILTGLVGLAALTDGATSGLIPAYLSTVH